MTRQEIIQGVKNLDVIHRSNPTMSGLRIVINALKDYADEAKKINEIDLSDYLLRQALHADQYLRTVSTATRAARIIF